MECHRESTEDLVDDPAWTEEKRNTILKNVRLVLAERHSLRDELPMTECKDSDFELKKSRDLL